MHKRLVRPGAFRGQSVVEFSLVSVLLLMLTFGIIDLGRGVFARVMLTNAVREATRYGMIFPADQAGMMNAARHTSPSLDLPDSVFDIQCQHMDPATLTWGPWGSLNCVVTGSNALGARDRIQVCVNNYPFQLTATRLIKLDTIRMTECGRATVQ